MAHPLGNSLGLLFLHHRVNNVVEGLASCQFYYFSCLCTNLVIHNGLIPLRFRQGRDFAESNNTVMQDETERKVTLHT